MLALLRDPLPPRRLALLSVTAAVAVAVYCLGYSALSGQAESLTSAFGWALVNILPWLPALEGAKRARNLALAALSLAGGLSASLALGFVIAGTVDDAAFELWRRVPALLLVSTIALGLRWSGRPALAPSDELPLLPRQIDWVRAAGNYVELRSCGRTIVHRASLTRVERQLASHGFLRIHRSMLVRRDCIARIRADDLVLADGTHLRVGKRYRSSLAA